MRRWSEKELELLKSNVNENYEKLIKLLPDRTLEAIIGKKDRLKLIRKSSFYWSEKADNYLINNYSKKSINELSRNLDKSGGSIHSRRIRLIKRGIVFKDKKEFFSKYWKNQYKTNVDLINKHKKAIDLLWENSQFRKRQKLSIETKFKDLVFFEKHKRAFLKRRNSIAFRKKQGKIASDLMRAKHSDPIKHKKMLENLRKNPSNQQLFVTGLLRDRFGRENVGSNDWNILEGNMEVDIPIYNLKTAIEWDGEYWHSEIKGVKEKDAKKNEELLKGVGKL